MNDNRRIRDLFSSIGKGSLIKIEWIDVVEDSSWLDLEESEIFPPANCRSYGEFLNCDDMCCRIQSTISGTQGNVTVIPLGLIMEVREIEC